MSTITLLGAGVCVLIMARSAAHQRHPLRAVFGCTACGLAALALVNLLAPYTGVDIALNRFTAFVGAVLGLPGVILLLVLNTIFL